MNDEKSNCMVLKQKQKHHETNNRWKDEGEELQMERFRNSRERVTRVPGSCPRPEFQPRLCWVVCLRCSWVPPGMQEKGHCHSWVSSLSTLSPPAPSRLRQSWWAGVPSAASPLRGRGGAFSIHLLGIFVHPAPGTQGAPDGLFGHS